MNVYEREVHDTLTAAGFELLRSGWPDFFVRNRTLDEAFGLEWKTPGDVLRPHQEVMHDALACHFGFDTLVASNVDEILRFRPRPRPDVMTVAALKVRNRLRDEAVRLEHTIDRLELTRARLAS